jgi:hypothetical protein
MTKNDKGFIIFTVVTTILLIIKVAMNEHELNKLRDWKETQMSFNDNLLQMATSNIVATIECKVVRK